MNRLVTIQRFARPAKSPFVDHIPIRRGAKSGHTADIILVMRCRGDRPVAARASFQVGPGQDAVPIKPARDPQFVDFGAVDTYIFYV